MSFDPESVERWDVFESMDGDGTYFAERVTPELLRHPEAFECVKGSDYDEVLKLYYGAMSNARPLCSHGCIEGQCAFCK